MAEAASYRVPISDFHNTACTVCLFLQSIFEFRNEKDAAHAFLHMPHKISARAPTMGAKKVPKSGPRILLWGPRAAARGRLQNLSPVNMIFALETLSKALVIFYPATWRRDRGYA